MKIIHNILKIGKNSQSRLQKVGSVGFPGNMTFFGGLGQTQ